MVCVETAEFGGPEKLAPAIDVSFRVRERQAWRPSGGQWKVIWITARIAGMAVLTGEGSAVRRGSRVLRWPAHLVSADKEVTASVVPRLWFPVNLTLQCLQRFIRRTAMALPDTGFVRQIPLILPGAESQLDMRFLPLRQAY